jgi:hypothetical protein
MRFAADQALSLSQRRSARLAASILPEENQMANFKRPARLLAAGFVFFALTSVALAQQVKEIKLEGQSDQDAATRVALAWTNDKTKHGPIFVRAIKILNEGGKYVALVQYSNAN